MEKPSFNNIKKDVKKSSGLPMWAKAAVLSAGLAISTPAFSQENKTQDDKNKFEVELFNDISSFYNEKVEKGGKKSYYWDTGLSKEDSLLLKKDKEEEINRYKNISNNPEEFYKKQLKIVEEIKSELFLHFLSPEFIEKLQIIHSKEESDSIRQELIHNIESVKIVFRNPDLIAKESGSGGAAAYYLPISHIVVLPYYNLSRIAVEHELIHAAYRGDKVLKKEEIIFFKKSFQKNEDISRKDNKYLKSISERIARKKQIDFYLKNNGILKYGEKFTKDHYEKLRHLKETNQLNGEVEDLFNTSSEDKFIQVINEIAFNDNNMNEIPDENIS